MSRQSRMTAWTITLGLLVVWTAVATAQDSRREAGRGRGMTGRINDLMLLRSEQVQKELKLNEEQKTKLEALREKAFAEARSRMGDMQDLSQDERRKRFEQMQSEREKRDESLRREVAPILQPEQLKRLRQIELQQQGASALLRPEVAETIGLTDQQKKQLQEIHDQAMEKARGLFEQRQDDGDRQGRRERLEQLRQEGEKQAMAVLQPEQKQKLGEMMGEPFELDRSQLFPRRGGNRQGRTSDQ